MTLDDLKRELDEAEALYQYRKAAYTAAIDILRAHNFSDAYNAARYVLIRELGEARIRAEELEAAFEAERDEYDALQPRTEANP